MPGVAEVEALFACCSRMMLTITRLPQPVIARVHGLATAAGCQLVATCDLAVASESATFATPGVNIGAFCSTPGWRWGARSAASTPWRCCSRARRSARRVRRDRPGQPRRAGRGAGRRSQRDGDADRDTIRQRDRRPARRCSTASSRCRSTRRTPSPDTRSPATSSPRTARKGSTPFSASARPTGRSEASDRGDDGRERRRHARHVGCRPRSATSPDVAMELQVKVGAPLEVGAVPRGRRRIVPIEGGTFKGPIFAAPCFRAAPIGRSFGATAWRSWTRATR